MNTLPPAEAGPTFQEECEDYSYLDPALLGTEAGRSEIEEVNQITLDDMPRDPRLFSGQKGIHMVADEAELALAENSNSTEAKHDREAIHTLEEAAFTGVVSEGMMSIRGCHGCIKEACALKGSLEKNIEEGDRATQALINIRDKVMHRRFVRKWADNFSRYNQAEQRLDRDRHGKDSGGELRFMGSMRDGFRDMLMEHVQPQGRDLVMRDIYSALPDDKKRDFTSFSNGLAVEVFVFEELQDVVDRFTKAGRKGCSVRFSNVEEDVKFGTDLVLTLTDKHGHVHEFPIDAKSRGKFHRTQMRKWGELQYFGSKEVKGRKVLVANPEGDDDENSFVSIDNIDGYDFTSYSKHKLKGKFGSKVVSTLLKSS